MKKTGLKELLEVFLIVLTALFVISMLVFVINAKAGSTNRIANLTMEENSKENTNYYKYNEEFMFAVEENFIAIMRYDESHWPLKFACGTHTMEGDSVNYPFQNGTWFYALNGDTYRLLNTADGTYTDSASFEKIESLGLTFYEEEQVTAEDIMANYEPLSVQKESCLTISAAFLVLYIVLIPIYLVVWALVRHKKA
jgi:hypothetical protein